MDVLVTGAYGSCGTALIDHLHDDSAYDFVYYNRSDRPSDHPYGGYETIVGDILDADALTAACDGQDALVHLAANPGPGEPWTTVFEPNIIGMYYALEAARVGEVDTFVFASTNHVMGMYELDNAPAIYGAESDIMLDHTDPVRPDSYYGTSKSFGEDLGRYYVENFDYPSQFYSLRICSVRDAEFDHPYGDAERGVERGDWTRGSEMYDLKVARMKAMWHSRRDFAQLVDRCLTDGSVEFDIFAGVSANENRWFDIEHAREVLDYDPEDDGATWSNPPNADD